MRKIIYLFIFAIIVLVLKAFVFDEYIERYFNKDSNTTSVETQTPETVENIVEPEKATQDANVSKEKEENITSEKQKMPLEQLGDEFSKHIKL